MLKKIIHWSIAVFLLLGFAGSIFSLNLSLASAQTNDITVEVNGHRFALESKPIIVNDYAMLPLRDTFQLFGCENIAWDGQSKTVTAISGELVLKMQVDNKTAHMNEEEVVLDQPAVLKNGRVYLPIRFLSNTFDSYIKYASGKIYIITPFLYQNKQWYAAATSLSNDMVAWLNIQDYHKKELVTASHPWAKQVGDTFYYGLYLPGSSIDSYHLYRLSPNGEFQYLMEMEGLTHHYTIDQSSLYYAYTPSTLNPSLSVIKQVDLTQEPMVKQAVGQADFSYGCKLKLQKSSDGGNLSYQIEENQWEVKPEGLYAVGYASNAMVENTVKDIDLLKQTYGYYFINPDTNEHKMVKQLELEYY